MWMIEVSFCSEKSAASYCIDNNLIFLTLIFWILSLIPDQGPANYNTRQDRPGAYCSFKKFVIPKT